MFYPDSNYQIHFYQWPRLTLERSIEIFEFPEIASQEVLGIECTTTLEEALEEVIPWIKDQAPPNFRELSQGELTS